MARSTVTDGGELDDDLAVVETIRVDREAFKTALRKNYLDARFARDGSRTDVLRVTPPFDAEMEADHYVSEAGRHYASSPKPVHIRPERLVDFEPVPEWPTRANTKNLIEHDGLEATEERIDEWLEEGREIFWGEVFARGLRDDVLLGRNAREEWGPVTIEIVDE